MRLSASFAALVSVVLIAGALGLHVAADRYSASGVFTIGGRDGAYRLNMKNGVVDLCLLEAEPPGPPQYQDYLPNRYVVRCQDSGPS